MKSLAKHMLYPADVFVGRAPCSVTTILGSCISVCLHDPVQKQGAINHYILPHWNGCDPVFMKYGNLSIIGILRELLLLGSRLENVKAQIYGGAEILTETPANFYIGKRNTQIAFEILNEFQIPVFFSDVGGNKGRKISFNTYSGKVELEYIGHKHKV